MQEDIIQLQRMLAHQQEEISSLSAELYAQQKESAELRMQLKKLNDKLSAAIEQDSQQIDLGPAPPPPHY